MAKTLYFRLWCWWHDICWRHDQIKWMFHCDGFSGWTSLVCTGCIEEKFKKQQRSAAYFSSKRALITSHLRNSEAKLG